MEGNQLVSVSLSFNSYASPDRERIAARVVEEFLHRSVSDSYDSPEEVASNPKPQEEAPVEDGGGDAGEEDFEFPFVCRATESSPISADEIFSNGRIRPVYPLFNQELLFADGGADDSKTPNPPRIRLPLGRLMMEDREPPSPSCSSSEAEELEGVPAETYCVWNPTMAGAAASRQRCKKSNSTGALSKRWRLRNLLFRSNSDGKDGFAFLAPSLGGSSRRRDEVADAISDPAEDKTTLGDFMAAGKSKPRGGDEEPPATAAAAATKESDCVKRKGSFLPYKEELLGFFSNVNGLSRNVHPF